MRHFLVCFVVVLSATQASAAWNRSVEPVKGDGQRIARSRHYIASLDPGEIPSLEARGIEVREALSAGRFLVRVPAGVTADARFERLTAEKKIDRRALRAAASARPFITVTVQFHADLTFAGARAAVYAAGATVEDPLQQELDPDQRLRVRVPAASLLDLASDERVVIVYGPSKLRPVRHNKATADLQGVTPLHSAPYNLTGNGVTLSFFEFGPADAAHPEFEGRLTTHFTETEKSSHATHVAGTIIAAGIDAGAKGMAPDALLHQFEFETGPGLSASFRRKEQLPQFGSIADNNSFGLILGWCEPENCDNSWVWEDTEEYYGAYDSFFVAPLDRIARETDVLFVHSSGNDGTKLGPRSAPHAHRHSDDEGELITGTFCYADTSGACPATPCTAGNAPNGDAYCETTRHPEIVEDLPAPFGSVGLLAAAKNILAVGAVSSAKTIVGFSSRGPVRDGRVKPDLVARGLNVKSTFPNNSYQNLQGTSMASPAVTGMAALLTEQWRRLHAGENAGALTLKTLLIAGAEDLGNPGPDYIYGFGLAQAKASVDLIVADNGEGRRVRKNSIDHAGTWETAATLTAGQRARFVIGWDDPEVIIFPSDGIAVTALVNDLDLHVIGPGGEVFLPYSLVRLTPTIGATQVINTVDPVEMVEFTAPAAGEYRVIVAGSRIASSAPQNFVLVSNADLSVAAVCLDEANNTEGTAIRIASGGAATGRVCQAGDNDFYSFVANEPGTITVTVSSADTALRFTLSGSAITPDTVEVPAGESRTLAITFAGNTASTFFVRVVPVGTIGNSAAYTVSAEYPFNAGPRRRAVRR